MKSAPRASTSAAAHAISSGLLPASCTREARFVRRAADQRELTLPALFQPARDHHLADEHPGAELDAQAAVGKVRALRHRRHDEGAGETISK